MKRNINKQLPTDFIYIKKLICTRLNTYILFLCLNSDALSKFMSTNFDIMTYKCMSTEGCVRGW